MKNIVLSIIIIICIEYVGAQTQGKIEYTQDFKLSDKSYPVHKDNVLLINDTISLFINNTINDSKKFSKNEEGKVSITIKPEGKNNEFVYKNFKTNMMYTNRIVLKKYLLQSDPLDIFNWEVINEFKNINGYKCQKAVTKFRGRNYIAYFTESIPIPSGPWKFGGLPGLILEIVDDENKIKIKAISTFGKLSKKDKNILRNITINSNKAISWKRYKKKYIKAYENFSKNMKSKYENSNIRFEYKSKIPTSSGFEIFKIK